MAILASLIWLWCQENMVPKEVSLFDGNRRHKGELGSARIKIRTFLGKDISLPDWRLPPQPGDAYTYDSKRQEWVRIDEKTRNEIDDKVI